MSKLDKTYNVQNGCHNCEHVFVKTDYDDVPEYFCRRDKSGRPLCMSVAMKECPEQDPYLDKQEKRRLYRVWDKWSEPREVKAWGTCAKMVIK